MKRLDRAQKSPSNAVARSPSPMRSSLFPSLHSVRVTPVRARDTRSQSHSILEFESDGEREHVIRQRRVVNTSAYKEKRVHPSPASELSPTFVSIPHSSLGNHFIAPRHARRISATYAPIRKFQMRRAYARRLRLREADVATATYLELLSLVPLNSRFLRRFLPCHRAALTFSR